MDRVRRVTDLFVEGTELYLGDDADGPVILWVNKLNPYQQQEAIQDGQARRFVAMARLKDSGAYEGFRAELSMMSQDAVADEYIESCADEITIEAMNDLDVDESLREKREAAERVESVVADADAPQDAPVYDAIDDLNRAWLKRLDELTKEKRRDKLREAEAMDREELETKVAERWRMARTQDEFLRERRVSEVFYALRRCRATRAGTKGSVQLWDHADCDHNARWLENRGDVHDLPSGLIDQVAKKLEELTVDARAAGNSAAPASSSESSEPSSEPEEASKPSSLDETPNESPAT